MKWMAWTLEIASRRNIRSRRDLWVYVARMTLYIAFLSMMATALHSWGDGFQAMAALMAGTFLVTAILAIPITWEFGRMYLDLWEATQTLHVLARTDRQTGLLNNHTFVARVSERLANGRRVALLLADLDRFKSINDRHGHPKGDEVIAAVGHAIRDLFGPDAVVGRMGGEEFAVALDSPFGSGETARTHSADWADELRRRVAAIRIGDGDRVIAPTASIGIAHAGGDDAFSDLYARADEALYVAKAAGRNRIVDEVEATFAATSERRRGNTVGCITPPPGCIALGR